MLTALQKIERLMRKGGFVWNKTTAADARTLIGRVGDDYAIRFVDTAIAQNVLDMPRIA